MEINANLPLNEEKIDENVMLSDTPLKIDASELNNEIILRLSDNDLKRKVSAFNIELIMMLLLVPLNKRDI